MVRPWVNELRVPIESTGLGKSLAVICWPCAYSIPNRVVIRSRFCRRKSAKASSRLRRSVADVMASVLDSARAAETKEELIGLETANRKITVQIRNTHNA